MKKFVTKLFLLNAITCKQAALFYIILTKFLFILYSARALRTTKYTQYIIIIYKLYYMKFTVLIIYVLVLPQYNTVRIYKMFKNNLTAL